jgi:hypothetical protein
VGPHNDSPNFRAVFLLAFNLSLTRRAFIFAAQELNMRKLIVILITLAATVPAFSQTTTPKTKNKFNLGNRSGDHFMIQSSWDHWFGEADSVHDRQTGFCRGLNAYLMLDFPFKGNQRFSAALGFGVSTSSMFFDKTIIDIAAHSPELPFIAVDTADHFKKYKLATAYLEVPLELRFTANPEKPGKTFKVALGIKGGLLINAHTKGKTLQNNKGITVGDYTQKISTKNYFNSSKFAGTFRIGYGYFSLFAAYNLTTIFKNDVTPDTRLFQTGLTISGL